MTLALIGLGSNLDRQNSIRQALVWLRGEHEVAAVSTIYESEAHGMDGPPFFNLAVALETDLSLEELRGWLARLEEACGRPKIHDSWEPRTLDADLLLFGDLVDDERGIPDPDVLVRPWVLVPLVDIAADVTHPVEGRSLRELLEERPGWRRGLRVVSTFSNA